MVEPATIAERIMPESEAEFRALVRRMREAQRDYFRTRSPDALARSKELERKVDAALRAVERDDEPNLFTGVE